MSGSGRTLAVTDEELKSAECREFGPEGNDVVAGLVAEVRRLKKLTGKIIQMRGCPWCRGRKSRVGDFEHDNACPTFSVDGSVK